MLGGSVKRPGNALVSWASVGLAWHRLVAAADRGSGRGSVANDEILTLKEVAQLLKVAEKTVYTMAQNQELPAFKVRGQWRFRREDIDRWIDQQTEKKKARGDSNG